MRLTQGIGSSGFFVSPPIAIASTLASHFLAVCPDVAYTTAPTGGMQRLHSQRSNVGASLLAIAVYLNHRHREQVQFQMKTIS
ncbi:hypothetical protein EDB98_101354 [Pseudomonas fluorescens]|nr:hypothetical protein EDB98_101354 [Pseudomonas fluorescens]SFW32231.1 hypothetical protein SAMN03159439_01269 [Pseudomonas sp. NFACC04-2]